MDTEYSYYYKNEQRQLSSLTLHEFATIRCPQGHVLPLNKPEVYGLYFVGEGKGIYILEGKKFPAKEGDCFAIFPGTEIKCQADSENPWGLIILNFDGTDAPFLLKAAEFDIESPLQNFKDNLSNEVLQVLTGFYRFRGQELYHGVMSTTMLYMLMSFFIKTSSDYRPRAIPKSWTSSIHYSKAMEFISSNYSRGITVDDIAAHVNLSRSRLYRIFEQQMAMSPHQYLTKVRMLEACRLLEKRDATIKEVAHAVGINDPLYFSSLFKKHTGTSPSDYLKALSAEE